MEYSRFSLWIFVLLCACVVECDAFTIRQEETTEDRDNIKRHSKAFNVETGRVRRDAGDIPVLCNTETPAQCGCFQCNSQITSIACCSEELPKRISDEGVSLVLSTTNVEMVTISSNFDLMVREALAEMINSACLPTTEGGTTAPPGGENTFCSDIYLMFATSSTPSSISSLNIVIFSMVSRTESTGVSHSTNQDIANIIISLSVVSYLAPCQAVNDCISETTVLKQSTLTDLLTTHNSTLEQIFSGYTLSSISPWIDNNVPPPTSAQAEEPGQLRMDLIITGGVFAGLLFCTCLISAAKAVRDRRKIKERRAEKRLERLRSNGSCTQITGSTDVTGHTAENGDINGVVNGDAQLITPDIIVTSDTHTEDKAKQINGHWRNGLLERCLDKPVTNGKVKNGEGPFLHVVNVTIEAQDRNLLVQENEDGLNQKYNDKCETVEGNLSKTNLLTNGSVVTESSTNSRMKRADLNEPIPMGNGLCVSEKGHTSLEDMNEPIPMGNGSYVSEKGHTSQEDLNEPIPMGNGSCVSEKGHTSQEDLNEPIPMDNGLCVSVNEHNSHEDMDEVNKESHATNNTVPVDKLEESDNEVLLHNKEKGGSVIDETTFEETKGDQSGVTASDSVRDQMKEDICQVDEVVNSNAKTSDNDRLMEDTTNDFVVGDNVQNRAESVLHGKHSEADRVQCDTDLANATEKLLDEEQECRNVENNKHPTKEEHTIRERNRLEEMNMNHVEILDSKQSTNNSCLKDTSLSNSAVLMNGENNNHIENKDNSCYDSDVEPDYEEGCV